MKIGTSILSLPNFNDFQNYPGLDFVDITRQKLLTQSRYSVKPQSSVMSLIDTSFTNNLTFNTNEIVRTSLITSLAECAVIAHHKGLTSMCFGSPGLRQDFISDNEWVDIFVETLTLIKKSIKSRFTLYVEPLPNKYLSLNSYFDIIRISNLVNDQLNSSLVKMKPLFDTGWWLNHVKFSKETRHPEFEKIIASSTDRIHFSLRETVHQFDENDIDCQRVIRLIDEIVSYNPDINVVYEHVNLDQNKSIIKFIEFMNSRYRNVGVDND